MIILVKETFISKFLSTNLAPASRCSTEIDDSLGALKYLKKIIDLEELVGGPGPIAFFLGLPIINILN